MINVIKSRVNMKMLHMMRIFISIFIFQGLIALPPATAGESDYSRWRYSFNFEGGYSFVDDADYEFSELYLFFARVSVPENLFNIEAGLIDMNNFKYNDVRNSSIGVHGKLLGVSKTVDLNKVLAVNYGINALYYTTNLTYLGYRVGKDSDYALGVQLLGMLKLKQFGLNAGIRWFNDVGGVNIHALTIGASVEF